MKKILKKMDMIMNYLSSSAIYLYILITMIVVVPSILFILGGRIFSGLIIIIIIIAARLYFLFYKKENVSKKILSISIGLLIFIVSIFISSKIYDNTADGNTYHKLAVGAMKNGWNPVWEDVSKFNKDKGNPFDIYKDNVNTKWVNTYAKGSEIYGAVIYSFSKNIESGKSFNIIFVFIGLVLFYKLLRALKLKEWQSMLVSLTMAFNPILITQLTNYYLDGVLSICLFLIIILIMNRKLLNKKENYLILGMSIIWACSIKFTGVAFAGVFCALFFLYNNYIEYKKTKKLFNHFLINEIIFYSVVVIVSILIVGSSSYTKNFIKYGHPLYPLYGKGHVDNMVLMEMPLSMQKDNKIMIFTKGIFCKSENSSPRYSSVHNEPDWKIPFTISKKELTNFVSPDLRIGGFGYFFGGVFIISIIGSIVYLVYFYKNKKYEMLFKNILLLVIIFMLVFILDGSYWARYIPYVYMIPILTMINLMIIPIKKKKLCKFLYLAIALFLLLDSVLIIGVQSYSTLNNNHYIKDNISIFKKYCNENKSVNILLNHHGIQGIQYNLDDLKIDNYKLVEKESDIIKKWDVYNFKY